MDESAPAAAADVSRRRFRATHWLLMVAVGLLVAAVVVGIVVRPWRNTPWWPGVHIASASPDPCPALNTEVAGRLMPTAVRPRPEGRNPTDPRRECTLMGRAGLLSVEIIRATDGDLTAVAAREFDMRAARYEAESVPDLADAAAIGIPGTASVIVLARLGNVVVTVSYFPGSAAPSLADGGRADCIAIARTVVAAIQVE